MYRMRYIVTVKFYKPEWEEVQVEADSPEEAELLVRTYGVDSAYCPFDDFETEDDEIENIEEWTPAKGKWDPAERDPNWTPD
jgi:hypothetical protein